MKSHLALIVFSIALLSACGGDRSPAGRRSVDGGVDQPLPTPAGAPGSAVTGMPDAPGPGQVGPPVAGDADLVPLDSEGYPLVAPDDGADPHAVSPLSTPQSVHAIEVGEPGPQEAVGVVRDYYAAINARNFAQAFGLWSDGGRATGQSPQQFANGFARTNGVSVELMAPSRIDAAAGSRYIEVPVALSTTMDDGSQRKFVGMYTLRRTTAEGATAEQRAWRIASAELREVQP